ncbi:Uncharacterised protein [Vibrio cholerae]|nr:Uncharacterised protein [Vibrio cholerae]
MCLSRLLVGAHGGVPNSRLFPWAVWLFHR